MNNQGKTGIDWCDCTINPVVGCPRGCPYCYAKKINDRFKLVPDWKRPEFFPERLEQFESKKSKSIFVDSMSDIEFWEPEWIEKTLSAMKKNRQHKYIFLTKANALPYNFFYEDTFGYLSLGKRYVFFGKTVESGIVSNTDLCNFDFLSIEPLLGEVSFLNIILTKFKLKQIIIGAETGNRQEKVIPKKEWVNDIVEFADKYGIRIFMKKSLIPIMGEDFRQDKLIWGLEND